MGALKIEGAVCGICGTTTRYASNSNCVFCKAKWQRDNRDKVNAANRASYGRSGWKAKVAYHRNYHLQKSYSLSPEEYDRMYREQLGQCAICAEAHAVLCVDHNHETGAVRALLCRQCNTGIGQLRDSVALVNRAAHYLNHYN